MPPGATAGQASGREVSRPAGGATSRPFWQYALFGSGIGASNIAFGSTPTGGNAREIIIGGNSASDFGADDFWQVIRRNPTTGNYDQLFVSPLFSASIQRIAKGNLVGDSQLELAVMLENGLIYFYDLNTKAEIGSINTGIGSLAGLNLTDLDGDGYAELIVTTSNNLYVFNSAGSLLWQVAGAGGYDVVAGQMDNDPALEIAAMRRCGKKWSGTHRLLQCERSVVLWLVPSNAIREQTIKAFRDREHPYGGGFDFAFHPDGYAPSRDYARAGDLAKHYYPRVGAFDCEEGGEEEQCAYWLDRAAQRGEIEWWVRNLVRKPTCSFFLPTAKDRFYPDFVCKLPNGRILVVEYNGGHLWNDAEPNRKIGELWEELSDGKCAFVMVKDKRWDWIAAKLA